MPFSNSRRRLDPKNRVVENRDNMPCFMINSAISSGFNENKAEHMGRRFSHAPICFLDSAACVRSGAYITWSECGKQASVPCIGTRLQPVGGANLSVKISEKQF